MRVDRKEDDRRARNHRPEPLLRLAESRQPGQILDHHHDLVGAAARAQDRKRGEVEEPLGPAHVRAELVVDDLRVLEGRRHGTVFAFLAKARADVAAALSHPARPRAVGRVENGHGAVVPANDLRAVGDVDERVGLIHEGGELLALPVEDPEMIVERLEPALVAFALGAVADSLLVGSGLVRQHRGDRLDQAIAVHALLALLAWIREADRAENTPSRPKWVRARLDQPLADHHGRGRDHQSGAHRL